MLLVVLLIPAFAVAVLQGIGPLVHEGKMIRPRLLLATTLIIGVTASNAWLSMAGVEDVVRESVREAPFGNVAMQLTPGRLDVVC